MTVVEIDASYTKHLNVSHFMITPGQTVSALVTANQKAGRYYMAVSPWKSGGASFQPEAGLGIIDYISPNTNFSSKPVLHTLPDPNNIETQKADRRLFYVVSLNVQPCPPNITCRGPGGQRFTSSINNSTFVSPSTSIMEAYYRKIAGVYTTDFPDNPPMPYDYVGRSFSISELQTVHGTRVSVIPYGADVQMVLQTTINLANDSHPFHLHGFDFYIVGEGKGNFNATRDEPAFNLVDPPRRNTALIPIKGWVALRFKVETLCIAGVWLLHCHLEGHVTWGMEMAFIVQNGKGSDQTLPPPPKDLPKC